MALLTALKVGYLLAISNSLSLKRYLPAIKCKVAPVKAADWAIKAPTDTATLIKF